MDGLARAAAILSVMMGCILVLPSAAEETGTGTRNEETSGGTLFPLFAGASGKTDAGFDTWAAYRARWDAMLTATIQTTDTVKMLRTALDPLEAPRSIATEGKIDRVHLRAKANVMLDFGHMQVGMQMKTSAATSHTLQRSVLVLQGQWMPVRGDAATTTTQQPEALLLDLLMLPDPNGPWSRIGSPEDGELNVDGCRIPSTFVTYRNGEETMAVTISVDGRAVLSMRVQDRSGRLRSIGEARSHSRDDLFGLIPRDLVFRQFDGTGQPYRDLHGVVSARFNEPGFDYLFE